MLLLYTASFSFVYEIAVRFSLTAVIFGAANVVIVIANDSVDGKPSVV